MPLRWSVSCWPATLTVLVSVLLMSSPSRAQTTLQTEAPDETPAGAPPGIFLVEPARPDFAEAERAEREVLERMLVAKAWPRRAIAAMRFERYGCQTSAERLRGLLQDPAWQVRAWAIRALARRREPIAPTYLATEENPRVVRTALRYRLTLDPERIERGVRTLSRSADPMERMLAVEIGAASGNTELIELAREICNTLILRMNRPLAGALSARLASVTESDDQGSAFRWRRWRLKVGRGFHLVPVYLIDDGEAGAALSGIADLPSERFAALEDYIQELATREIDLAVVIDCTASMSGELQVAQGGIDDFLVFAGDVARNLRFGLVAYRDRRDREFETRVWDFTGSIDRARAALWSLSADGGGDRPEMVYDALRLALSELSWASDRTKVLVLVGDAPPHPGEGALCINLVSNAVPLGLRVHVIQTENRDVKHFPEIAAAGNGRCVNLKDDAHLIAEVAGLTMGDVFQEEMGEFFRVYLELCR